MSLPNNDNTKKTGLSLLNPFSFGGQFDFGSAATGGSAGIYGGSTFNRGVSATAVIVGAVALVSIFLLVKRK